MAEFDVSGAQGVAGKVTPIVASERFVTSTATDTAAWLSVAGAAYKEGTSLYGTTMLKKDLDEWSELAAQEGLIITEEAKEAELQEVESFGVLASQINKAKKKPGANVALLDAKLKQVEARARSRAPFAGAEITAILKGNTVAGALESEMKRREKIESARIGLMTTNSIDPTDPNANDKLKVVLEAKQTLANSNLDKPAFTGAFITKLTTTVDSVTAGLTSKLGNIVSDWPDEVRATTSQQLVLLRSRLPAMVELAVSQEQSGLVMSAADKAALVTQASAQLTFKIDVLAQKYKNANTEGALKQATLAVQTTIQREFPGLFVALALADTPISRSLQESIAANIIRSGEAEGLVKAVRLRSAKMREQALTATTEETTPVIVDLSDVTPVEVKTVVGLEVEGMLKVVADEKDNLTPENLEAVGEHIANILEQSNNLQIASGAIKKGVGSGSKDTAFSLATFTELAKPLAPEALVATGKAKEIQGAMEDSIDAFMVNDLWYRAIKVLKSNPTIAGFMKLVYDQDNNAMVVEINPATPQDKLEQVARTAADFNRLIGVGITAPMIDAYKNITKAAGGKDKQVNDIMEDFVQKVNSHVYGQPRSIGSVFANSPSYYGVNITQGRSTPSPANAELASVPLQLPEGAPDLNPIEIDMINTYVDMVVEGKSFEGKSNKLSVAQVRDQFKYKPDYLQLFEEKYAEAINSKNSK